MYRDLIARAKEEVKRLEDLMEQKVTDKRTTEEALRTLETICDTNLNHATFKEKQNIITKLGVKVYPSDNGKVVRIVSRLNPSSKFRISPYKISMASPKL